ncbi:MAG: L,D-transpeptidase [Legionellaceae bacterium]|nr:L,D-transpeptidase [Legionellaceae bacterium]
MKALRYYIKTRHVLASFGFSLALLAAPGVSQASSGSSIKVAEATTTSSVKPYMVIARNTFVFSPRTLRWKAINDKGKVVRTGKGSGGKSYCKDTRRACLTPTGTFSIISKRGANCRSSKYPIGKGGSPMPYCMFFSKYYAVHGSYHVPNHNASHGCVRIKPNDARWLYNNFMRIGTKVIIKSY